MVEATLYVALVAFHVCLGIVCTLGQCSFTITQTVRFDIGFGYHIDTILVAKFIEEVVIRVVASTYRVKVELLHDLDVLNHSFARYYIASVRIQFMAVGSLEQYRLPVYQQLCVLDFNLTETYVLWDNFQYLVAFLQSSTQRIEVRSFGSPLGRIFYGQSNGLLTGSLYGFGYYHLLLGIEQFQFYGTAALHGQFYGQSSVLVFGIQIRSDADVLDLLLVTSVEVAIAGYTGIAEEVLVFQISTVAPTEYLESNQILLSRL